MVATPPWTERILAIPKAVASRFARPSSEAWEELVSVGNLEMLKASRAFDPNKSDSLHGYLYHWVLLRLIAHQKRQRRKKHSRLSHQHYQVLIDQSPDGTYHHVQKDYLRWVLSFLSERSRNIFVAHALGASIDSLACQHRLSAHAIKKIIRQSKEKLLNLEGIKHV